MNNDLATDIELRKKKEFEGTVPTLFTKKHPDIIVQGPISLSYKERLKALLFGSLSALNKL